jgi:hypothetical protein
MVSRGQPRLSVTGGGYLGADLKYFAAMSIDLFAALGIWSANDVQNDTDSPAGTG